MVKANKKGLTYYPMSTEIEDDNKILKLEMRHRRGFEFITKLWSFIYSHGCYVEWDEIEKIKFCRNKGFNSEDADDLLGHCFDLNILDRKLYRLYNVLTSSGIQKRYMQITKRWKYVEILKPYLLVSANKIKEIGIKNLYTPTINEEGQLEIPNGPMFYTARKPGSGRPLGSKNINKKDPVTPKEKVQKDPIKEPEPIIQPVVEVKTEDNLPNIPGKKSEWTEQEVSAFISVNYEDRDPKFKELWNESWYKSYITFNKLIDEKYPVIRKSKYQITLPEYYDLYKLHNFNLAQADDVLKRMSATGVSEANMLVYRFTQFWPKPGKINSPVRFNT